MSPSLSLPTRRPQTEYDLMHLALFMARPILFFECQPERWNPALDAASRRLSPDGISLYERMENIFTRLHSGLISQPLARQVRESAREVQAQGGCPVSHYYRRQIHGTELAFIKPSYSIVRVLADMLSEQGADPLLRLRFEEEYQANLPRIRENLRSAMGSDEFQDFYARADYLWRLTGHSAQVRDPLRLIVGVNAPADLPFDPTSEPLMTRDWAALCLATLEDRLLAMQRQWQGEVLRAPDLRDKPVCGPLIQVARRESARVMQSLRPLDAEVMAAGLKALATCRRLVAEDGLHGLPLFRRVLHHRIESMMQMLEQRTDWVFDRPALDKLLAFSLKIQPSLPKMAPMREGRQR